MTAPPVKRKAPAPTAAPNVKTSDRVAGASPNAVLAMQQQAGNQATNQATAGTLMPLVSDTDRKIALLELHKKRLGQQIAFAMSRRDAQQSINDEFDWTSGASEAVGGAKAFLQGRTPHFEIPSAGAWFALQANLASIDVAIAQRDVRGAARLLAETAGQFGDMYQELQEYLADTLGGAATAQTGLEVARAAGAIAAMIASGGIAGGAAVPMLGIAGGTSAGLLGTATAVGVGAGTYGVVQEGATQTGEMSAGSRSEFDFKKMLAHGAKEAVIGFVSALTGGFLARQFAKLFGGYLSAASEATLAELGEAMGLAGKLPRDYFLTTGQRFIADFLGNAASTPITVAVSQVIDRATGARKELTQDEFLKEVFQQVVEGGIMQVFIGFLTHGAGRLGRSKSSPPPPDAPAATKTSTNVEPMQSTRATSDVELSRGNAANDNVELQSLPRPGGKAANDNVELPPSEPMSSVAVQEQPLQLASGGEMMSRPMGGESTSSQPRAAGGVDVSASKTGSGDATVTPLRQPAVNETSTSAPSRERKSSRGPSKAQKQGQQVLDKGEQVAADRDVKQLEAEIARIEYERVDTGAPHLQGEKLPMPPELKAEWDALPKRSTSKNPRDVNPVATKEAADLARLEAMRTLAEKHDPDSASGRFLRQQIDAMEQIHGQSDAAAGNASASKQKESAQTRLESAKARFDAASRSVKALMRLKGRNYSKKCDITYDEILKEKGWAKFVESKQVPGQPRKPVALQTDHLVPLDTIAELPELTAFLKVYADAPPKLRAEMIKKLTALGDIDKNLVRMNAEANNQKRARSWDDISYEEADAFGYKTDMVDKMRKDQSDMLQHIKTAIDTLTAEMSARL